MRWRVGLGNGKGQDGERGTWMVKDLEHPNAWVLEVNAFCCYTISLYSHVGMARGKNMEVHLFW